MTTAEILRAAKAHLIKCGWVQGDDNVYGPDAKGCCAATAMAPFVDFNGADWERPLSVFRAANGIADTRLGTISIGLWNDAPERTLDEVLAAFDKAIAAAEESARGHQE